jgi:hypothetical protein
MKKMIHFNIWSEDYHYYYYVVDGHEHNFGREVNQFISQKRQAGQTIITMNNRLQFDINNMTFKFVQEDDIFTLGHKVCIVGANGISYQSIDLEQWEIIRECRLLRNYLLTYEQLPESIKPFYPEPFSINEISRLVHLKYPHLMK